MESQTKSRSKHPTTFPAFHAVRLRRPQVSDDVTFTAGTRGVIVDVYEDDNYGVEFSTPVEDVLIVAGENLEVA